MSKYRVYELAKEYNTTSKVIIDILGRHNIVAKNHMSSVDEDAKVAVEKTFARKTGTAEQTGSVQTAQFARTEQREVAQPGREAQTSNQQQHRPQHSTHQQPHANNRQTGNSQQPPSGNRFGNNQQQMSNNRNSHQPQTSGNRLGNNQPQRTSGNRPGNNQQQHHPNQRPGNNQQPQQMNNRPGNNNYPQKSNNRPNNNNQQRPQTMTQQAVAQQRQMPNRPAGTNDTRMQGQQNQNNNRRSTNSNFARNNGGSGHGNRNNGQRPNQHRHQQAGKNQSNHVKAEMPKPKSIRIGESITVKDLAGKMGREVSEIIKKLMMLGTMASINQVIDFDTVSILGGEFGVAVEAIPPEEDPTEIPEIEDDEKDLVYRPPVVTVMGHVDHGKTSLLDSIRQTHVTSQEAGGITQHIGAYQVMCQGKKIVFLDTPGHEAFTAMRARGAQVTDIAILVVAADDGVMPQTIEAINHAKSAKVPIIVAINKIDRPGANPDRVKQQLAEHQLIPEDWGGDTIMVPVSAHQKTGISDLLEMILLVAEMLDLKANPNRLAYGTIIEAKLDKGRGPVATILVQKGTLRIGDTIIAGTAYGKVRAMTNDRGEKIKKAEPATPVEVLGLADVPEAGDILVAVDERTARVIAEKRVAKKRSEEIKQSQKVSLDDLFKQIQVAQSQCNLRLVHVRLLRRQVQVD